MVGPKKKKKKKTRRIQIWRRRQTFGEFFGGQKNLPTKNLGSVSVAIRLGHPTVAWKASHVDSGLMADMLMPKGLEKKWDKFTVTSCWAIAVAKCGEKNVWTYGGTARSMQNSQDNLYGSHHVQVLLKMQQTLSNFGWLLCGFILDKTNNKTTKQTLPRSSPKFVIHFWKQFWLLKS